MFIGRKEELRVLEETYQKPGFQMTVIYGRRRIGKSCLISEFLKDKKASYYVASQSSLQDNVKKWSGQFIQDLFSDMAGVYYENLETFFQFIANSVKDEKVIIALDEIPYIAETDESFLSRFQAAIDTMFSKTNLYLILCGSAISFMEREILSEKSPLFGRRSNQIFLKPFNYLDSAQFTPAYSAEERAVVFGVTGGVAKYLTLFDDTRSLDENLIDLFFRSSGYLYEEPTNLLTQEFRTINTYHTVIEVCAGGANKTVEIADKAHISTAALSYVIKNLMTIGVISKVKPITEKSEKRALYEISDGMYRFWYSFVPAAKAAIEMNRGDRFYYAYVKDKLHLYMGSVFEEMCRYYTLREGLEGNLSCFVTNVGKWWGPDHDHKPTDLDVVGIDDAGRKAVIGECKFRNTPIDREVYENLMGRRGLIDQHYEEVQYLLFSLSGFTDWILENAEPNKVKLVTLEDMYKASSIEAG